jgi:hypothetical protein
MAYILRQKTIIAKENSRMPSEELNKLMLDFNLTHSYQTRIYVRIFFSNTICAIFDRCR